METLLEFMTTSNCKNSNDSYHYAPSSYILQFLQIIATPPPRRASLGLLNKHAVTFWSNIPHLCIVATKEPSLCYDK